MRIEPNSPAFSWLLGLLSALPTFGIDMILPTLPATATALGASPGSVGLAMSAYLLGVGAAIPVIGPLSDRIGRRPIIIFGCVLLIAASIGCLSAHSLPQLLVFRALQGIGASGPGMGALTIVRDLFDGEEARAKMSYVVFAVNVVPMIAPTVGAALLTIGGWRSVYWLPVAGGGMLLAATLHFDETARIDPQAGSGPLAVARDYLAVLSDPICLGNTLCNAAAAGAVFAYITGSSLFLIDVAGLNPNQYGVIFGASSLSVIAGSQINQHLGSRGVTPRRMIRIGLALSTMFSASLLIMALADGRSVAVLVLAMTAVALSFGLISPNAISEAMHPVPTIAGAAGAVVMFFQMAGAASSSWLVTWLFDGRSALSMAVTMLTSCLLAIASHLATPRAAAQIAPAQTEALASDPKIQLARRRQ